MYLINTQPQQLVPRRGRINQDAILTTACFPLDHGSCYHTSSMLNKSHEEAISSCLTHTLVENNFHCLLDQHSMVANTENIRRLNSYLNFKSRIKITDGRTFIGTFVCIDKEKNIILAHTEEFRGGRLDRVCTAISF